MSDQSQSPVSVIIPARNEELNIEGAVRSLALQPGIREIIVVDDQSEDQTAEILARLSAEFSKLRVLRLEGLPAGWLGKTHAAAEGAKRAAGEWLLFTDADTRHKQQSLAARLARAEMDGAALLSISPGQRTETWWEKAAIPLIYWQLAGLFRFEDVNNPRSPAAAANGQYMLIQRTVYDAVGGWASVRNAALEDAELAKRVKSAGGKIVFLPGAEWVETRMYRQFGEMWRGWTKNLFLLYGRDTCKIVSTILKLLVLEWLPGALLLALSFMMLSGHDRLLTYGAWFLCLLAFGGQQWVYGRRLRQLGFSRALAAYFMLGAPILSMILLSSLWAYRRGGSIEWKGRSYPVKGVL